MNEASFSKQLRDDIKVKYPNMFCYLIQDSYRSGKKPFDFFIAYQSKFIAVELKLVKGRSIPVDILRPHQLESLLEVDKCGTHAHGVVIINIHSAVPSNAFVIPIRVWQLIMKNYKNEKSVKIETLMTNWPDMKLNIVDEFKLMRRLKFDTGTAWDVTRIAESVGETFR